MEAIEPSTECLHLGTDRGIGDGVSARYLGCGRLRSTVTWGVGRVDVQTEGCAVQRCAELTRCSPRGPFAVPDSQLVWSLHLGALQTETPQKGLPVLEHPDRGIDNDFERASSDFIVHRSIIDAARWLLVLTASLDIGHLGAPVEFRDAEVPHEILEALRCSSRALRPQLSNSVERH